MYVEELKEFHKAVYKKTGSNLSKLTQEFVPNTETANLRAALIDEEAFEACEELSGGTKEGLLKELCDVLYVIFGTAVTYNLPIEEAFKIVHQNNMLKIKNGTVGHNGKFIKAKDHPKCDFSKLLGEDKQLSFNF